MQNKQNISVKLEDFYRKHIVESLCAIIVAAIIATFYVAGCVYNILLGRDTSDVLPSTWGFALYRQVVSSFTDHPLHHWGALIFSGLIPPFLAAYYYFVYRKVGSLAVKWLIAGALIFLCFSWVSGLSLFYLATKSFAHVAPLAYIQILATGLGDVPHNNYMETSAIIGALAAAILMLIFLKDSHLHLYGAAHFATLLEAKKAKLFAPEGILIGKAFGKYLCMGGFEHVTLFSPSGSGKTVGLTIPNLFNWHDSCVACDIKLTLFANTSAYRVSLGHKIFLFNPGSPDGITHCYNPLSVISANPYTRIDEIQKIAAIFIPDNLKSDPIWQVQSRFLFVALVLYVLDTEGIPKNIAEVIKIVKQQENFSSFLHDVITVRTDLDPVCRQNFMKFNEMHEKTRQSILATFLSYFELFDNPLIAAATSKSDFDIRALRREKMTIYVGVTNDNLVRLAPLLTVFYQQVTDALTRKVPAEDEPYGVLFIMDEFSSLRRMEAFHKNIGLYREYRLRVVIIIQELSQLYEIYGRDGAKVFINAKVRIAFTQNDHETCKALEEMLGNKTVLVKNLSRKIGTGMLGDEHKSEARQYIARPLMTAQEIRVMPEDREIIFIQGHPPVYAHKIVWYKDSRFQKLAAGSISVPSVLPYLESDEFKAVHVKVVEPIRASERPEEGREESVAEVLHGVQAKKVETAKDKREKEVLEVGY